MADVSRALPANVAGDWFVDSTCIDCDTCRQLAPRVFGQGGDFSFVHEQPAAADERAALRALVSCPTGSIGTRGHNAAKAVMNDFPLLIEGDVYFCLRVHVAEVLRRQQLLHSPSAGESLMDSPKYLPQLVRKFEALAELRRFF